MVGANLSTFGGSVFHPSSLLCGSRSRHPSRDLFPRGEAPPKHRWFCEAFFSFHKTVRLEVVSLLCVRLAKEFFAVVSGLPDEEVVTYFRRTLSGLKTGHKVSLIVNDEKQLLLKYNFRSGHLNLCFHYGEWDKLGNPQHHYSVICCRTLTWQQCASLVRVWSSMMTGRIIHELHGFQVPAGQ